jgi:hypothetical protein
MAVWFYTILANTFTNPDPSGNEFLLQAHIYGNKTACNVWQTTHINNTFFLHLLDYLEGILQMNFLLMKLR